MGEVRDAKDVLAEAVHAALWEHCGHGNDPEPGECVEIADAGIAALSASGYRLVPVEAEPLSEQEGVAGVTLDVERLSEALREIASDLDDADHPAIKADRMRNIARAVLSPTPEAAEIRRHTGRTLPRWSGG